MGPAELEQQIGASPNDADLAEALGATVEEVREVAAMRFHAEPLDGSPADDVRPGVAAFLATPDANLESADDRVSLAAVLSMLDEAEREMLLMRYGAGMTQREIAEARGISQMHVSRALKRILIRVHDHLVGDSTASGERTTPSERPGPARAGFAARVPAALTPDLAEKTEADGDENPLRARVTPQGRHRRTTDHIAQAG